MYFEDYTLKITNTSTINLPFIRIIEMVEMVEPDAK